MLWKVFGVYLRINSFERLAHMYSKYLLRKCVSVSNTYLTNADNSSPSLQDVSVFEELIRLTLTYLIIKNAHTPTDSIQLTKSSFIP